MSPGSDPTGTDALAARLAEIDDLHTRGVLNDEERAIARRAALDKAMTTSAAPTAAAVDTRAQKAAAGKEEADGTRPRVRLPLVAGAIAAVIIVAAVVIGVVLSRGGDATTPVAAAPAGIPDPPAAPSNDVVPYTGGTFSISYPRGWIRETTDEDMGGYFDTTWAGRQGKDAIVRVNTSPGDPADGYESALMLERGTQSTPGYQRVSITRTTLGGMPAARWEFLTTGDSGKTLRTVNVLASDGVDGWAVLTRNPVAQDAKWSPVFRQVRESFEVF